MTVAYRLGGVPDITGLNVDPQDWHGVHMEHQLPGSAQDFNLRLQTP